MKAAEWRQEPPDCEGEWLRLNMGRKLSVYRVALGYAKLRLIWGENEECKLVTMDYHKLKGWWWYGPIKLPDVECAYTRLKDR